MPSNDPAKKLGYQQKYRATPKGKENSQDSSKRYRVKRAEIIDSIKEDMGCLHCGIKNPVVLHFHHRDPSTKEVSIANGATISLVKVLREIEKCDVLCANCHLIEHERLRDVSA